MENNYIPSSQELMQDAEIQALINPHLTQYEK